MDRIADFAEVAPAWQGKRMNVANFYSPFYEPSGLLLIEHSKKEVLSGHLRSAPV